MNKTALITGASSGIGKEYAIQLAAQGYDLVITARREDRLRELQQSLESQCGIEVRIVIADLSQSEGIQKIKEVIEVIPRLDMLVNNAGFGSGGRFASIENSVHVNMIAVHLTAAVVLAKAAALIMKRQQNGTIINVASVAGFIPLPGGTVYPATKAFLISFSQSLGHELKKHNIYVQALCPGMTSTEFHDTEEFGGFKKSWVPTILWSTCVSVVNASLKACNKKKVIVIPNWWNRVLILAFRVPLISFFLWKKVEAVKGSQDGKE